MHADGRESEGVEHYRRDRNRSRRSVIARAGYFTTIRDARNHRPAIQRHGEWNLSFAVAAFIAGPIRNLGFSRTGAACPGQFHRRGATDSSRDYQEIRICYAIR